MSQINLLILNYTQGSDLSNIFVSNSEINYTFYDFDVNKNLTSNLIDFLKQHQNEYNIVTSNKVTSNLNKDLFNYYLSKIIQNNNDNVYLFGVCYISKWLDKCLTYGSQFQLANTGTTVVRTQGPRGFNTILISPEGSSALGKHTVKENISLNSLILEDIAAGRTTAIAFTESLISYDPLKASSVSDLVQTNECEVYQKSTVVNNNTSYLVWFIILIVILFVVVMLMFRLTPYLNYQLIKQDVERTPIE